MHLNNGSEFFDSELNSFNFQQIIVTVIFQCSQIQNLIFNFRKFDMQNSDAKINV